MSQPQQHHSEFFADLINGTFQGALYAYSIEQISVAPEAFELTIQGTSLSELDDKEEVYKEYIYESKNDAEEDIQTASRITKIDFDLI